MMDIPKAPLFADKLVMSSLNGLYIFDFDAQCNVFINPEYTRITGYTLADIQVMRTSFFQRFHPEDHARINAHFQRVQQVGDDDILEIEYRFQTADGRWIWCYSRDTIYDRRADGSVRRILGTFLDVSNRKQTEAALLRSEATAQQQYAELEAIYNSAPVGLCVLDRELRFVRINDRLAEINGVPAADHVGRKVQGILPDLAEQAETIFQRIITTGKPVLGVEISGTTPADPDQKRTWVEHWLPLKTPEGQILGMNVVAVDVTERKQAEKTLQQAHHELESMVRERTSQLQATVTALQAEMQERKKAEQRLHQWSRVFTDAADPIIIEDLSGTIIDLNREAERVYGWSRAEMIGKPIRCISPPDRHHWSDRLRERCKRGEEVRDWEGMRQDRSGRAFPVLVTAFPLVDAYGGVVSLATIAKDITVRKQMESELLQSQRHLQELSRKSIEALESDRKSTAKELHDSIGASLAAIKFRLEGIAVQIEPQPRAAAASLKKTIAYLVDAIKETKRISAKLRPTTLDDLGLLSTLEWYFRQFAENYGRIRVMRQIDILEDEIPESLKIVIYRVLQEALHNTARHSDASRVWIQLSRDQNRIRLAVEDNGCGFDVQGVEHRENSLSGFGLKSMQERAEICGGTFRLDSQPGKGTTVSIALPISSPLVGGQAC
jgi:PAS domain S-box-containing protein